MRRDQDGSPHIEALDAYDDIEDELNRLLLTTLGSDDWGYVDRLLEGRVAALARYQAAVVDMFRAEEMRE
jgi:hypothetical protein